MSESVILCEGFHDRAFWDGWLSSLAFYSNLWLDPRVVVELDARLRSSGAWQIAAALAD